MVSFIRSAHFQRIVISVCAGIGETECQASAGDLVLCFDNSRRSLFSGKFMSRFFYPSSKRNVIFSVFDYSHDLLDFMKELHLKVPSIPKVLLFQHPSPSPEVKSRTALKTAILESSISLKLGYVSSIHFVFDHNSTVGKNTWSYHQLSKLVRESMEESQTSFSISEENILSSQNDDYVNHPVFGEISKVGWALMKKGGSEIGFIVTLL